MKVTNDKTENSQAFLTIEMDSDEIEESLEKAYRRLVQKAKVPGFRQGRAPRAVLERHIGSESLFEDALNNLVPQVYAQAIKEQEIEAIAQPQIEIAQTDPVIFKAVVPLKPRVELGDYQHIKVTSDPVSVADDEIDTVIEHLRHQYATWEPLERAVDFGDLVIFDVESSVGDEPFINQKGAQHQVIREQTFPAPGFSEQLVGMKRDEEKEFKLQFPSDYSRSELAEKEARFKVVLSEIKQEILPELNNNFAREVNPDFKTMSSLRKQVISDMKLRVEERARLDFEERVIDAVVDVTELDFPPVLVESEVHRILDQRFQRGNQEMEEYLRSVNKTDEELHEELHPVATTRVSRALVLGTVAEKEKIEVSELEIDTEIGNMIKGATENNDELAKVLNTPQARQSIEQTLIARKTMQRLVAIATGSKLPKTTKKKGEVENE